MLSLEESLTAPFNPIPDGSWEKGPAHTRFSSATSNTRISTKNIVTFSFNPFPHCYKVAKSYLVQVLNY